MIFGFRYTEVELYCTTSCYLLLGFLHSIPSVPSLPRACLLSTPERQDEPDSIRRGIKPDVEAIGMDSGRIGDTKHGLEPDPFLPDVSRSVSPLRALSDVTDGTNVALVETNLVVQYQDRLLPHYELQRGGRGTGMPRPGDAGVAVVVGILDELQHKVCVFAVQLEREPLNATPLPLPLLHSNQLLLAIQFDTNSELLVPYRLHEGSTRGLPLLQLLLCQLLNRSGGGSSLARGGSGLARGGSGLAQGGWVSGGGITRWNEIWPGGN